MGAVMALARSEPAAIGTAWPKESVRLTPWLAEYLDLLGEAVGLDLKLEGGEVEVGPFSADILAREGAENRLVLVENPCAQTIHRHLGQFLTSVAGLEASIATSVAESLREEHRAAIDYLNRVNSDDATVSCVEVRLFKNGEHDVPRFDVIAKPNNWSRMASKGGREVERGPTAQLWLDPWSGVLSRLSETIPELGSRTPATVRNQYVGGNTGGADYGIRQEISITRDGRLCAPYWISGPRAQEVYDIILKTFRSGQQKTDPWLIFDRMEEYSSTSISIFGPDAQPSDNSDEVCQHASRFLSAMDTLKSETGPSPNDIDHSLATNVAIHSDEPE